MFRPGRGGGIICVFVCAGVQDSGTPVHVVVFRCTL